MVGATHPAPVPELAEPEPEPLTILPVDVSEDEADLFASHHERVAPPQWRRPPVPALTLAPLTIEDVDRLWDWVRSEPDRGASFFGRPVPHSVALHITMQGLVEAETIGAGWVRAIVGETLVGFLALTPILNEDRIAVWNLYIEPAAREAFLAGQLGTLLQQLQAAVPGYRLCAMPGEAIGARLVELGYRAKTLYLAE